MKKIFSLITCLFLLFSLLPITHVSAFTLSGDGRHTMTTNDEIVLSNGLWLTTDYINESSVRFALRTKTIFDTSTKLVTFLFVPELNKSFSINTDLGGFSVTVNSIDYNERLNSIDVQVQGLAPVPLTAGEVYVLSYNRNGKNQTQVFLSPSVDLSKAVMSYCVVGVCDKLKTQEFTRGASSLGSGWYAYLDDLPFDTQYEFFIEQTFVGGSTLRYPESGRQSFVTSRDESTISSAIQLLSSRLVDIKPTEARIYFETNRLCSPIIRYWKSDDMSTSVDASDARYDTKNTLPIIGLKPNTNYKYQLSCRDKETQIINSFPVKEFTTPSEEVDKTEDAVRIEDSTPSSDEVPTTRITEDVVAREKTLQRNTDEQLVTRLQGQILLQVESKGEAWYVDPEFGDRRFLGRPNDAFALMRERGLGITNADLAKIPVGIIDSNNADNDGDGLYDAFERAIGTDESKKDSDDDGFDDKTEIKSGYNPLGPGKQVIDEALVNRLKGRILLQVEASGEAWYVNPQDGKRYFLFVPKDAYNIMRILSLGITNDDIRTIPVR